MILLLRLQLYWPTTADWETVKPADAKMDPAKLEQALKLAGDNSSQGVIVLRAGRIVAEQYWDDKGPDDIRPIFSVSKSFAAILVGMAIDDKKIEGVDQSALAFLKE